MDLIMGMNSGSSFDGIDVILAETEMAEDGFPKAPRFICGGSYEWPKEVADIVQDAFVNKVDMVVTLHACDTATDYALAKAVGWDAKVILSVPCCQHELNRQIKNEILEPILKYGLLKERMAALITDGLRAQYLEREGYEAQILEFIDMEHTPKNILIRAVKKRHAKEDNNIEASIKRCEAALRVSPTLGRLLDGFATESANSEKDHPEKEDKEGV